MATITAPTLLQVPQTRLARLPRRLAKAGMTALLVGSTALALLIFASSAVPVMFGHKTMVVSSGSMAPAIMTGDAVLIKPAPSYSAKVGDVITFVTLSGRGLTTHRVAGIFPIGGETYFQTKGDANSSPDPDLTHVGAVVGTVRFVMPKAGYLLHFGASPFGKLLILAIPLVLLLIQEVQALNRQWKANRAPPRASSRPPKDAQHARSAF